MVSDPASMVDASSLLRSAETELKHHKGKSVSFMICYPYHLCRLIRIVRIIYAVLDMEEELRARLADMEQAARVAGTHGKQRVGRDSKLLIGETIEIPLVLLLLNISQQHFLSIS